MSKIYPNAPCPCGSGKKYKHCCGRKKGLDYESLVKSDLKLEDFVIEKISEDVTFLANALQLIIGPYGYSYCEANKDELQREYDKDSLLSYVKSDKMKVYATTANSDSTQVLKVRPYGGNVLDEVDDILSLWKKGHISEEGYQVELFHAYILDYLEKRFLDYLYVPTAAAIEGQKFGPFARRGYDFLLGLALYLELQLGVHVYLNQVNGWIVPQNEKQSIVSYFDIEDISVNTGMLIFLSDYAKLLGRISEQYKAAEEVALYHNIGAYTEEEYPERRQMISPGFYKAPLEYNYMSYLRYLVSATCFNIDNLYTAAILSFPQCDFVKYIFGLESIIELFEEKVEQREIDPSKYLDMDKLKDFAETNGLELRSGKHIQTRKNIYHTAVFWLADELNGVGNHMKPTQLDYVDVAEINDDEFTLKDGLRNINPARKSTSTQAVRKLKLELYQVLNGKSFALQVGARPGDIETCETVGKYPMLPWISNGKEHTVHCKPFDRKPRNRADLYSADVKKRQEYLTMEYRLTSIPVNCIEEYLNPDVFYHWEERNELLKETKRKNEELKVVNDNLKRHIRLNQELVRSLSHSSANYLNSDRLAQTGIALHQADNGNPTLDKLHAEGLYLMLQSEQELYFSRQLNGLVWRCSADPEILEEQLKCSLSKTEGLSILAPAEFAMKSILARILFREDDRRSEFIREKLGKTETEWTAVRSSFMLDILAADTEDGCVIDWWGKNIGSIEVAISEVWNKIKIIKNQAFYDLITEITTELLLNALSHGDVTAPVQLEFGQNVSGNGRPTWVYVACKNRIGAHFEGGRGVGVSSLHETILLLNRNEKGIEQIKQEDEFAVRVWLDRSFLRAKRKENE